MFVQNAFSACDAVTAPNWMRNFIASFRFEWAFITIIIISLLQLLARINKYILQI